MYYYLNGVLAFVSPDTAVIDCGGVGYKTNISLNTYKVIKDKKECKIYTYLNVKEDALDLYGFFDEQEKLFFTFLISISGVGPKIALAVLSEFTTQELATVILTGDAKRLSRTSGVGPKMAQRICLELKDKISKVSVENINDIDNIPAQADNAASEAISVLIALGYSKGEAVSAVRHCSADNTNDIVRQALRILSKNLTGMN